MNNSKVLFVITSGSYPYGGAYTNRHLSYLKGLVERGIDVKMLIIGPDKNQSVLSNKNNGRFNGVKYQYIIPCNNKNNSIFVKLVHRLKAIKRIKAYIRSTSNNYQDARILVLTTDIISITSFINFSNKEKLRIFHERTEYPMINLSSFSKKIQLKLYLQRIHKFDGIFVITQALKAFFENFLPPDKVLHLPMTVEAERFNCNKYEKPRYGQYIAYCGSMYTDKDGVPILIQAFDLVADQFPNISLVLIGDNADKNKFSIIQNHIDSAKHKDRIILTGKVERNQMPELLCNAKILALARPNNLQAKGGFPTKLGEYLATGNPVVITKFGEIPDYLMHKKNAFIAEPDSAKDFSNKLRLALNNEDEAKRIGLEGEKLVTDIFNYKIQAEKLKHFLFNT